MKVSQTAVSLSMCRIARLHLEYMSTSHRPALLLELGWGPRWMHGVNADFKAAGQLRCSASGLYLHSPDRRRSCCVANHVDACKFDAGSLSGELLDSTKPWAEP